VIDEEVGYITGIGNIAFASEGRLDEGGSRRGYDAVFAALGAPRGAISTRRAARKPPPTSISPRLAVVGLIRPHHRIGKRVIVMAAAHRDGLLPHRPPPRRQRCEGDCALRLREMKASPWEKEDAMGEDIPS